MVVGCDKNSIARGSDTEKTVTYNYQRTPTNMNNSGDQQKKVLNWP